CEYMTGGAAVILGPVGFNFAAGMTGGMAFVHDPQERLPASINEESVLYQRVQTPYYEALLRDLVHEHAQETQSRFAERLLVDWERELHHFWQVVPREMLHRLQHPVVLEPMAAESTA